MINLKERQSFIPFIPKAQSILSPKQQLQINQSTTQLKKAKPSEAKKEPIKIRSYYKLIF
jgi:hypothetical protein